MTSRAICAQTQPTTTQRHSTAHIALFDSLYEADRLNQGPAPAPMKLVTARCRQNFM